MRSKNRLYIGRPTTDEIYYPTFAMASHQSAQMDYIPMGDHFWASVKESSVDLVTYYLITVVK